MLEPAPLRDAQLHVTEGGLCAIYGFMGKLGVAGRGTGKRKGVLRCDGVWTQRETGRTRDGGRRNGSEGRMVTRALGSEISTLLFVTDTAL